MTIKSSFLSLSMREQVCITIVILTILSILVVLCLSCTFCYEILKEDYKLKKLYFYDKFKEYIELCFYFQNFCLLQFEELVKRMQLQFYKFNRNASTANTAYDFQSNFDFDESNSVVDFDLELHKNISDNNDLLFFSCFNNVENICKEMKNLTIKNYLPFSSMIFTHDTNKSFVIPGYQLSCVKSLLFVDVDSNVILSFNGTKIYEIIQNRNINCSGTCIDNIGRKELVKYYDDIVKEMMKNTYARFVHYFSNTLFAFKHMFEKIENEMSNAEETSIIDKNNNETIYEYTKAIAGYYSSVKFPEDKMSFISYSDNRFFYFESKMIENYMYFLLSRISDFLDVTFIPLNYENNTIISPELCIMFLMKQMNYDMDINSIKILFSDIKKGESNISSCFYKSNALDDQLNIKDVFLTNSSFFMTVNNIISEGILDLGNSNYYYYTKYTYPNYNVLKDFRSDYILLDQVNFYLFASFKNPIEYSQFVYTIYRNCFLLIILIVIYIWIICLIVNLLFFLRTIKQITEPIKKLQEAIETTSIKDENLFNYEYDDFINDLFITCKELLSGQIDKNNNEKGLGEFNIISIPKDKLKIIDKNIYQRNLIINNDIMEQLILKQQSMMDFSQNIGINELYSRTNDLISMRRFRKNRRKNNDTFTLRNNNIISDISDNEKEMTSSKNNAKQNKTKEEKNRETYIKLFRISEYINYRQNKMENNYIYFVHNNINYDNASNISRISNNLNANININGSLKNNSKIKRQIVRSDSYGKKDDKENYSINMLDNNDISYLWYMEAKAKNNQTLNYHIFKSYEELFMDNNELSNQESIKMNNDSKDNHSD